MQVQTVMILMSQYSPIAAWYKDNDGDTFGDETNVQFACDSVFSANNRVYVADPTTADFDCNDDPIMVVRVFIRMLQKFVSMMEVVA